MTTWDRRGLRAADTRDFPAPNRTSELEPCALLQLQGHAVCVRAGPWTPAPRGTTSWEQRVWDALDTSLDRGTREHGAGGAALLQTGGH